MALFLCSVCYNPLEIMLPENNANIARDMHERFYRSESEPYSSWKMLADLIMGDLRLLWEAKLEAKGDVVRYKRIIELLNHGRPRGNDSWVIKRLLAAGLVVDNGSLKIVTTDSEADDHEQLWKKQSTTDKRVSGKIIEDKSGLNFFLLDPISLEHELTRFSIETDLKKVAEYLIQQGFIPVDSHFQIIPFEDKN